MEHGVGGRGGRQQVSVNQGVPEERYQGGQRQRQEEVDM